MKKICILSVFNLSLLVVLLQPVFSQTIKLQPPVAVTQQYACEDDCIEVMFSWESSVRMRNEKLVDLATNALQGTGVLLNELAWHQWIRLTDVPESVIDQWERNGEQNTGKDLYNLNNIYRLKIPKGVDIWNLSWKLEALPGIYLARPVPKPVIPPALPPPPGSFQSQQGYLSPASNNPSGVNALYAWTQSGGTGAGVTICDLEYSWNYNHADITKALGSQINPNPITDPFSNTNHGTAVIGELVADNNGWGTTGICYGSGLKTCGTHWPAAGGWNVPGAITYAIASLSAGDIILLEQQWEYTPGASDFIPVEWWLNYSGSAQTYNAVYAAIVTAVANGIHVVEAGGNGNVNTGSLTWYGNSGAIIVGAGGATTTNDRQRLSFSSYGPRFNLQGWGENIVTTGGGYYGPDLYSSEGANYYYTYTFNGTSGASPIVTGALACAEGYYLANISSTPPTPAYMRTHLATYGTAQVYGPSGNIGPRPDIQAAIQNFPPPQTNYDWGDAPDPPYTTLSTNNGANHIIDGITYLGYSVDAENNGQPDATATGDDNDGNNDDDGVIFLNQLIPGQQANVQVIASVSGFLNAWIDFNGLNLWADPGEFIFQNIPLNPGINTLGFTVPFNAMTGNTIARFRFNTTGGILFYGAAQNGEVEDYQVYIGNEEPDAYDWGDAPDGPYPTFLASNGARHTIINGIMLGIAIDGEPDGQPDPAALGDDNDLMYPPPNDDEDGVVFLGSLKPGMAANVNVTVSIQGYLNAWFDFNQNGSWADPGEHIFIDALIPAGLNPLAFLVPPTALPGQVYARFRFSTIQGLTYTGLAPDGEVEDYSVTIVSQIEELDWGDAPDGPYPTLNASNGANHLIDGITFLGAMVDAEPDGQPDPAAMGDDNDIIYPPANDDEDGVIFSGQLTIGQPANINVTASVQGFLNAWIDFNNNGSWGDPGEQVFTDAVLAPGLNALTFLVPPSSIAGPSFARFRFCSLPGLSYMGPAPDGEVEDYSVTIDPQIDELDWGDAPDGPYPTLNSSNGARHILNGVTFLGSLVDPEMDGQPDPNAKGDDNNNLMDEDGVQFNWPLLKGSPAMITVTVAGGGFFNGWIDFDSDGSWVQSNEQIFTDVYLNAGTHELSFIVPPNSIAGISFARFRISSQTGLSYTGLANDGEVEDYEVLIVENPEIKWQQLPNPGRSGLHAHDYINSSGSYEQITVADDWLCNGGRVTDIHWWGNYELDASNQERRGMGIDHFHLSIHLDDPTGTCLPSDPEVWGIDIPFTAISEQFTGIFNSEGCPVYLYEFILPEPFQQIQGNRYWLDIAAYSVDPNNNAFWRWQEAIRSYMPILCCAADKVNPVPATWSSLFWPVSGLFTDMAFAITNVPDKTLNLKIFLEGLYSGGGLMNKAQDNYGDHFGSDTADVVTVELHNAVTYSIVEYTFTNVKLQTDGQASINTVPYIASGSYYITVKHRNSIETTTASPVSFAGNSITYDFSTAASQAYGSNQKNIGGVYVIYGGDVNQDGYIDTGDMTPVDNDSANFASGYLNTDVNGDGFVDTGDMTIIDNNSAGFVGAVTP